MTINNKVLQTLDGLVEVVAALSSSDFKKNLKAQKAESTRIAKLVKEYEDIVAIANNRIAEADEKDLAAATELAYAKEVAEAAEADRAAVAIGKTKLDQDYAEFDTARNTEMNRLASEKFKLVEEKSLTTDKLMAVQDREAKVGKMEAELSEKLAKLKAITG